MKRQFSLTQQLTATLALGFFALLLVGLIGMLKLSQSQDRFDYSMKYVIPAIQQMSDLAAASDQLRINALLLPIATPAARPDIEKKMADIDASMDKTMSQYVSSYTDEDVRAIGQAKVDYYSAQDPTLFKEDVAALKAWRAERDIFVKAVHANDQAAMQASYTGFAQASDNLTKAFASHLKMNYDLGVDVSDANKANYELARNFMLGLIVISGALSALFGIRMVRNMRSSLLALKDTMKNVRESLNLTQRAPVLRRDEIGETSANFNELLERLQDNLRTILQGADRVALLANSVTQASNKVSQSANVQSEASSAMAASIEQMTVSITHVADRASDTRDGAQNAGEKAKQGAASISETISDIHNIADVVEEAAESIRKLDEESTQVANVIQIIRDIADQTNLLALNAAIEAARAGEQGRGFAVVADEVRKLAERTAQSTLEIGATITKMRDYAHSATNQMSNVENLVQTGEQRADLADKSIREIGEATRLASEQVGEISQAISEQGAASQTIAARVEQVAGMAVEASQASEETARLSDELDELAKEQIRILKSYTL
ncbi:MULTISPECIES: methyl-accepting chemotaxis protein [unclassified Paludibacterium]|uniref:methyl-accepting chemotaxis protein n=1 Tax=unclassified Paludibacterium TaxID=2618429 RepID=UPI001C04F1CB|nr:methyl-accepting chemotaxis protein [Paludibacterium sp. B53371]BEV73702.1 hypothetical protein THUN1379_31840 [Paludibacterium sp. THUN1379]